MQPLSKVGCDDSVSSEQRRELGKVERATIMGEHVEVNVGEEENVDTTAHDENILEAPEEPADQKKVMPTPEMPTLSEILKHREDHIPYQSWCKACVEGRGCEMGHSAVDMSNRSIPTISFDYMFVNDKGLFLRSDIEETSFVSDGTGVKVLVAKDSTSKIMLFAHVVPSKGIDDNILSVDELTADIVWLG